MRAHVVVASNRASAGVYEDRTGPIIRERLTAWGYLVGEPEIVADGPPVKEAIARAIGRGVDVVLTTGGTGPSPTDRTPEQTRALLDFEVPGVAEAIRARGIAQGAATAALSRAVAGVAGGSVVVNLPGSPGGVRDGLDVLADLLEHWVSQVRGGDHAR